VADLPSNQSTTFTAGTGIQLTFTETEGAYWDIDVEATGGAGGHTIAEAGTPATARGTLNFGAGFDVADDSLNDETDVTLDLSEVAGSSDITWTGNTPAVDNDSHAHTSTTVTTHSTAHAASAVTVDSTTLVGTGTDVQAVFEELDNGIVDHAAAADPHTGYRLESADHTHATTGAQAGQLDHGLALTGLTDDDHTQYLLLAGRSGGQSAYGGTGSGDDLTLESTSHATKGYVNLQPNGGNVGVGTATPGQLLHVVGNSGVVQVRSENTNAGADLLFAGLVVVNDAGALGQFVLSCTANNFRTAQYGQSQMTYEANGAGGVAFLASNVTDANNVIRFLTGFNTSATEKMRISGAGYVGIGTDSPGQLVELAQTETITGAVTDGYAAALRLDPCYTAATALTVTRHNYIDVQDVSVAGAGPAAVTNAALFRFDANIGTHKALAAAFTTTDSGTDTTSWAGGIIVNVNGTLYKVPFVAV